MSSSANEKLCDKAKGPLCLETINANVLKMQYALRGPIVLRAQELEKRKQRSPDSLPNFEKLLYANVGNPQLTGQLPITFVRQLIASLVYPAGSAPESTPQGVPSDVLERAKVWLEAASNSMGCYSQSKGIPLFRSLIADWLSRRDGFPADPETVFLTDGASSGVKMMLELIIQSPADGILVPVPEYPLYTASIVRLGGTPIPYYLDEEREWRLDVDELTRRVAEARARGVTPRALVIINPGNPTGSLLSRATQVEVVKFCQRENLLLFADEVYQQNIYHLDDAESAAPSLSSAEPASPRTPYSHHHQQKVQKEKQLPQGEKPSFVSFRKLVKELSGPPVQLASLHSASKGLYGECGFRGGMVQLENIPPEIIAVVYKMASVTLCANTIGQAVMTAVVTPPSKADPSYPLYAQETATILTALARKAALATKYLNSVAGISCQPIRGALYAYPKLELPSAAIAAARNRNQEPDMLFCLEFLDAYGVVCVPGSGFGQKPGTFHVRLTILPALDDFEHLLKNFVAFYQRFCRQYETDGDLSPEKAAPVVVTADDNDAGRFDKKQTTITNFSTNDYDAVSTTGAAAAGGRSWDDNEDSTF